MKIFSYIRSHAVLSTGVVLVAIATAVIAGRVASRSSVVVTNDSNIKKVSLVDVNTYKDSNSKISADGVVESVSQVDLRSQIGAPVVSVNVSIGDTVYQGQVIATLQNADVRALLDQARAGLQVAEGQYTGTGISLESSRNSAIENIRGAYLAADEAVNIELSQFLYEKTSGNPSLDSFIVDQTIKNSTRTLYLESRSAFSNWKKQIDALSTNSDNAEILSTINSSQQNLTRVSALLDVVSDAISEGITKTSGSDNHGTLIGWQATVSASRSSVNNASKSLTTASASLSNAQVTSETPAQAQISSAEANVRNLEVQLAKTIITSPISGKIADLSLRPGELAQPGQLIATVIGGGGLQIKAYASGEDLSRLKEGAKALIENSINGTVISVAPSVSQANKKVELKVAVTSPSVSTLIIGQNVNVVIDAVNIQAVGISDSYLLPIQNVKIVPGNAYVFTVDSESKLVKNPVTIGKIEGNFVEITSGINGDMKIVSPVYELEEGEIVTVQ